MEWHVIDTDLPVGDAPVGHQALGRCCAHPGCQTRLSRYNPDVQCAAHGGWTDETVTRPGRRPRGPIADAAPTEGG